MKYLSNIVLITFKFSSFGIVGYVLTHCKTAKSTSDNKLIAFVTSSSVDIPVDNIIGIFVFADENSGIQEKDRQHVVHIPAVNEWLAPIVYSVPVQLLSYHVFIIYVYIFDIGLLIISSNAFCFIVLAFGGSHCASIFPFDWIGKLVINFII